MKILGLNVIVQQCLSTDRTESGIIVPESSRNRQQEGTVVAIGSRIKFARQYTKGTKVFVEMYKGKPFPALGSDYVLVEHDEIIGVAVLDNDKNTRFHPIGDRILMRPLPPAERPIIQPSAYESDDEYLICEVMALNGVWEDKEGKRHFQEVMTGDKVVIPNPSGRDVEAADGIFKLVKASEILAIILPNEN